MLVGWAISGNWHAEPALERNKGNKNNKNKENEARNGQRRQISSLAHSCCKRKWHHFSYLLFLIEWLLAAIKPQMYPFSMVRNAMLNNHKKLTTHRSHAHRNFVRHCTTTASNYIFLLLSFVWSFLLSSHNLLRAKLFTSANQFSRLPIGMRSSQSILISLSEIHVPHIFSFSFLANTEYCAEIYLFIFVLINSGRAEKSGSTARECLCKQLCFFSFYNSLMLETNNKTRNSHKMNVSFVQRNHALNHRNTHAHRKKNSHSRSKPSHIPWTQFVSTAWSRLLYDAQLRLLRVCDTTIHADIQGSTERDQKREHPLTQFSPVVHVATSLDFPYFVSRVANTLLSQTSKWCIWRCIHTENECSANIDTRLESECVSLVRIAHDSLQ